MTPPASSAAPAPTGSAGAAPPTPAAPATISPHQGVIQLLNQYKPVVDKLLARTDLTAETFMAQVANAMRSSPAIWECEPATILGAALRAAQLGLAPNDGNNLCWIIPYKSKATFQLGYGGVLELARRAEPGITFDGRAVYPGDLFEYSEVNGEPQVTYAPAFARTYSNGRRRHRTSGDAYAWFVTIRHPDGRVRVHALDRDRVEYHRSFSKLPNSDAWTKSYDAMALKSVVLDMRRWLAMVPQLQLAGRAEGQVIDIRELDAETPELPAPDPDPYEEDPQ